MNGPN
jgi:coniferyl-aldehyde dehydrogenase